MTKHVCKISHLNYKRLLRKLQKTLGGYFILPHPVDCRASGPRRMVDRFRTWLQDSSQAFHAVCRSVVLSSPSLPAEMIDLSWINELYVDNYSFCSFPSVVNYGHEAAAMPYCLGKRLHSHQFSEMFGIVLSNWFRAGVIRVNITDACSKRVHDMVYAKKYYIIFRGRHIKLLVDRM